MKVAMLLLRAPRVRLTASLGLTADFWIDAH
jgi:hypothetical protein